MYSTSAVTGVTSRAAVKETSPSIALLDDVANKISSAIERIRGATASSSQVADSIFGAIPETGVGAQQSGYNPNARCDVLQAMLGTLHVELNALELVLDRFRRI